MGGPSTTSMEDYAKPAPPAEATVAAPNFAEQSKVAARDALKTSALIALLTKSLADKGDLPVAVHVFHDSDNAWSIDPIVGHHYIVNEARVAEQLVLCDDETLDGAMQNLDLEEHEVIAQGGN